MNLTYDLVSERCFQTPQIRYTDRVDTWSIACTGRALRAGTSWRAAIATERKIDDATVIVRINEGITVNGSTIQVPIDVFFAPFRDAVAAAETGRALFFALWETGTSGDSAEYIEFKIKGFPAIDPPGDDPKPLPDRPVWGIITDPITSLPVYDETWGYCRYLDDIFPEIAFIGCVTGLRKIRLKIVSINADVTGDIVLVPVVDGEVRDPVVVSVGAEPSFVTFDCSIDSGTLVLRRDSSDSRDTLQDGGTVTAVVLDITFRIIEAW